MLTGSFPLLVFGISYRSLQGAGTWKFVANNFLPWKQPFCWQCKEPFLFNMIIRRLLIQQRDTKKVMKPVHHCCSLLGLLDIGHLLCGSEAVWDAILLFRSSCPMTRDFILCGRRICAVAGKHPFISMYTGTPEAGSEGLGRMQSRETWAPLQFSQGCLTGGPDRKSVV